MGEDSNGISNQSSIIWQERAQKAEKKLENMKDGLSIFIKKF